MRKLVLLLLLCLCAGSDFAQQRNADSVAYEAQRKKINDMLDARRAKFGQYSESLSMHTGIFGFQTKKDIRHSADILMDIAQTDEEIFRQTKILLDYRAFQQTQAQTQSTQTQTTNLAYMNTINKLRNELEHVKIEAENNRKVQNKHMNVLYIIIALMLVSILVVARKKRDIKI